MSLRHSSITSLPEVNKNHMDGEVDLSLLDVIGVDDFMSLIRVRQEKNHTATWDAALLLAQQWKALRGLLSSTTNLLNKQVDAVDFEKILEIAHKTLNAERIVILQYDPKDAKLVVVAAREQTIRGVRIDINQSSEGEVFRTGRRRRISDVRKDSVFISFMDSMKEMNLKKVSSVICSPILVDGKVVGIVEACNRLHVDISSRLSPYKGAMDYVPFSQYDEMNLEYIASCIGLVWTQQTNAVVPSKEATPAFVSSIQSGADYDAFLDFIISETYKGLEADRVSLFAYDDKTEKLECKISKDIKGLRISTDKGIVGQVFNTLQVLTVEDAKSDKRHFTDIDENIGYQTRTIICAPVLDANGKPIGVIQALNKKDGKNFTSLDAKYLSDLCEKTSAVLRQKLHIENGHASSCQSQQSIDQGDILSKSVVSIMEAVTLVDLTMKVEQMSTSWGNCDCAGIYLVTKTIGADGEPKLNMKAFRKTLPLSKDSSLSTIHRGSNGNAIDNTNGWYSVPETVAEACKKGVLVEQKLANDSSLPELFLGDYPSVRRVLICPINLRLLLKENESTVLILGRKNMTGPFGLKTKKNVEMLIQLVEKSAKLVFHNLSQSQDSQASVASSTPTVLGHKHVLSSILSEVNDAIFLLNGQGYIIGSNKSLERMLDVRDPSVLSALANMSGRFTNQAVTAAEYHYTSILSNHPILSSDISNILLLPKNNNNDDGLNMSDEDIIKRSNIELKPGINVDYTIKSLLVDVDIEARGTDNDMIAVILSPSKLNTAAATSQSTLSRKSSGTTIIPPANINPALDTIRQSINTLEASFANDLDILTNIHHMSSVLDTVTQLLSAQVTPRDIRTLSPGFKSTSSKYGSRYASTVKIIATASSSPSKVSDTGSPSGIPSKSTSPNKLPVFSHPEAFTETSDPNSDKSDPSPSTGYISPTATYNEITLINHPVDSLSPLQIHPLIVNDIEQPGNLFSWEFNVLEHKNLSQLRNICGRLFDHMFDFEEISISPKVLGSYIYDVSNSYHANPFHNFHHATSTLHFSLMLIKTMKSHNILSKLQMFAVMLSALVHDVDHPGNTNLFEIHTQSRLALRYNDQSVLENHHCSVAFQIMKEPRANVLGTLPAVYAAETRKIMISCILATDMSVHFQLVDEIKSKISDGCDFNDNNDRLFLSKILLHASDLSNPVRPFHISTAWARNISEEFNRQVELETSLGLPVLGFMMTTDEKSFCKNELGFASFVVAPMWRNLAILFPEYDPLVRQLDSNLNSWKSRIDEFDAKNKQSNEDDKSSNKGSSATSSVDSTPINNHH